MAPANEGSGFAQQVRRFSQEAKPSRTQSKNAEEQVDHIAIPIQAPAVPGSVDCEELSLSSGQELSPCGSPKLTRKGSSGGNTFVKGNKDAAVSQLKTARYDTATLSNPHDTYENLIQGITKKVQHKWWQTVGHGILAGMYIAVGGFFSLIVGTAPALKLENPGLQKLIFGLAFPVGLLLVVITGAELFTSNVISVSTWLDNRTRTLRTLGNLGSVWVLNFVGALFMAAMAYWTGVFADKYLENALAYTEHKVHQAVGAAFAKAVIANWLVALAVLMAASAHDFPGKVFAVWPPITAFVALGLEHSIANMFFLPLGRMLGADYTIGEMFVHNILPVTAGNFVGSLLVSLAYALLENKVSRVSPIRKFAKSSLGRVHRRFGKVRPAAAQPRSQRSQHHMSHDTLHHEILNVPPLSGGGKHLGAVAEGSAAKQPVVNTV